MASPLALNLLQHLTQAEPLSVSAELILLVLALLFSRLSYPQFLGACFL